VSSGTQWNGGQLTARITAAAASGLQTAAEHLLGAARQQAPLETGALRASGRVTVDGLQAAVSFDTPYAVRQHEELDYQHSDGKAKYLEGPMSEEHDAMARILSTAMRRATGG
jgi:hypothetical protein